jgi:hypothetical protein
MNAKKVKSKPTPSRTFVTIQDIYEFEDAFMAATLPPAELEELLGPAKGQPVFKTAKARDQYILDHQSDFQLEDKYVLVSTGDFISKKDPEFRKLRNDGKVITAQEFVDQRVVQPFRQGKQDKALISLEPVIFRAKGKTAPSVPYLKVFATTTLETSTEAKHLIHTKVRANHKSE